MPNGNYSRVSDQPYNLNHTLPFPFIVHHLSVKNSFLLAVVALNRKISMFGKMRQFTVS